MKKPVMLAAAALFVFSLTVNSVFAETTYTVKPTQTCAQTKGEEFGPPPFHHGKMDAKTMEKMKKEHQKRKAEMDARLKLTDAQKKAIEDNRLKDREKMKPIFEQVDAKRQKIDEIAKSCLSQDEKDKQIGAIKCELKELKMQANKLREENMKNFESILTPSQKTELEKMKQEHRKEMEKHKNKFRGNGCPPPMPPKD